MRATLITTLLGLYSIAIGCSGSPIGSFDGKGGNTMRKSRLQLAIERGGQAGGNLADELQKLSNYKISSRADGLAICDALATISYAQQDKQKDTSDLAALAGLFDDVEDFDSEGFEILCHKGLLELHRVAATSLVHDDIDEDALFTVLRILAKYGTREGAEQIVAAARKPLSPGAYHWSMVFWPLNQDHPQRDFIFSALSNPLPEQLIAVALLDAANQAALAGQLQKHPFDSAIGAERLRQWLTDDDPDHISFAVSATVALAFIRPQWRHELLELVARHPDGSVRLEAAWARAKSGDRAGISDLTRLCLNVNLSRQAQRYLEELERLDAVPEEASDPDFQAKAEFASWLTHPSELGHPPDEIEIMDHRLLAWPPEREPKPFWLIRYLVRDKTGLGDDNVGCGLVGSMTFCLFSHHLDQRPPEDGYAIHCYWEMKGEDLIEEMEVTDPTEYANMLSQWTGEELASPRIIKVAETDARLKYPQKLVALVSTKISDQHGWIVLDGPRSAWYPQADFPESGEFTVLNIHVGRQLLGFTVPVDRKKFLKSPAPPRDPRQTVETYERLLAEALHADLPRRAKLLADFKSPLYKHFERYVEAKAAVDRLMQSTALMAAYERFLEAIRSAGQEIERKAADELSTPLREWFKTYVDALIEAGREDDVKGLIDYYRPMWDHNLGYGLLAAAAFKAKEFDLAEQNCLRLRKGLKDYCRSNEMSILAEIWTQRGKADNARELLIDCLQNLIVLVKESKYPSDQRIYEEEFQCHRRTFLRLFPDPGELELSRRGIPAASIP